MLADDLSGEGLRELLHRAERMEQSLQQLCEDLKALLSAGKRQTPEERRRRRLDDVMAKIVGLEGAESNFRWVVRPGSDLADTPDENEDKALPSASTDPETFDAARAATVSACLDAQNAVSEAMRALDDPPRGTAERQRSLPWR